jgi:hypothetical protein
MLRGGSMKPGAAGLRMRRALQQGATKTVALQIVHAISCGGWSHSSC